MEIASYAVTFTRAQIGIEAPPVAVEVHITGGLPKFSIVGLAEPTVKESRERVRSALLNSGFKFPPIRITVNLAPADLRKEGGRFDLAIAIGILLASEQLQPGKTTALATQGERGLAPAPRARNESTLPSHLRALAGIELIGELALDGSLRPVQGLLPTIVFTARAGHTLYLPRENAALGKLVTGAHLVPAAHLLDVTLGLSGCTPGAVAPGGEPGPAVTVSDDVAHCSSDPGTSDADAGDTEAAPIRSPRQAPCGPACNPAAGGERLDISDVRGQEHAKRALQIAAAGHHNLLLAGPPGTGKTMLARRIAGLLPAMDETTALESASLRSVAGLELSVERWRHPPFRSPHHSASAVSMVGGGRAAMPGEVSLAHGGVLFLDELPEFERRVLEGLREPIESGVMHISRAAYRARYPARFQLIATMNPCPCGHLGNTKISCRCTPEQISRYQNRVSGPLLDRIDLIVELRHPSDSARTEPEMSSASVRATVVAARALQQRRGGFNGALEDGAFLRLACLDDAGLDALATAQARLGLSERARLRVMRVARTIADIDQSRIVATRHLLEALSYRTRLTEPLDTK